MSAVDDLILTLEHRHNIKLDTERNELADLRARALPAEIVDAVRVYQEAFLRWSSDCMNVDNVFILEKVKEELMRRIEADAKGEEK